MNSESNSFLLMTHGTYSDVMAWRHGAPITVRQFLSDVARLAAALPAGRHLLNACADRYRFTVGLAAALLTSRISLLPPSQSAETVRQMKVFAPDAFCLVDGPSSIDLPIFWFDDAHFPLAAGGEDAGAKDAEAGDAGAHDAAADGVPTGVPSIPADRTLAIVFTSGSTGAPLPHRKSWGALVRDVRAEAAALALPAGAAPQVVGTVPPQHMYGIESTVLLPLQTGGALCADHPFYPADICAALAGLPRPRMLVTTPVHLRALLDAGVDIPAIDLLLSATAPLSEALAANAETRLGAPLQEIYGATETGQIATRRSTHTRYWSLLPGITLEERSGICWASGGHIDRETPLGDMLELAPSGSFLLHGRIGDLVNVAGKRNSLAYLNHQLLAIDGVEDGVFFMPANELVDGVTRLAAFAVAPGLSVVAVRAALRKLIDPIFMPRPLVLLQRLPRNSTGKVTRETIETLVRTHLMPDAAQARQPDEA